MFLRTRRTRFGGRRTRVVRDTCVRDVCQSKELVRYQRNRGTQELGSCLGSNLCGCAGHVSRRLRIDALRIDGGAVRGTCSCRSRQWLLRQSCRAVMARSSIGGVSLAQRWRIGHPESRMRGAIDDTRRWNRMLIKHASCRYASSVSGLSRSWTRTRRDAAVSHTHCCRMLTRLQIGGCSLAHARWLGTGTACRATLGSVCLGAGLGEVALTPDRS